MVNRRKAEKTKKQLIAAGIELIREGGIGELSMRGVAKKCGLAPRAPYNYFKDAKELLEAVKFQAARELADKIVADEVLDIENPVERMTELARIYYAHIEKYPFAAEILECSPVLQYFIEEDGTVRQFSMDMPVPPTSKEGKSRNDRMYEKILMGSLIVGLSASVRRDGKSGEEELLKQAQRLFALQQKLFDRRSKEAKK